MNKVFPIFGRRIKVWSQSNNIKDVIFGFTFRLNFAVFYIPKHKLFVSWDN